MDLGTFPTTLLRTTRDRFRVTWLSGDLNGESDDAAVSSLLPRPRRPFWLSASRIPHGFDIPPQCVRSLQQRHIVWMFKVGEANHARFTMVRAGIVWDVKLFQSQHAHATSSQMVAGRRSHRTDADNDDVVVSGHVFLDDSVRLLDTLAAT